MFICPHCGEPGITWLQRATLGPAGARVCKRCGQRVSVPWRSNFVVQIPALVLMFAVLFFVEGSLRMPAILAIGLVGHTRPPQMDSPAQEVRR